MARRCPPRTSPAGHVAATVLVGDRTGITP